MEWILVGLVAVLLGTGIRFGAVRIQERRKASRYVCQLCDAQDCVCHEEDSQLDGENRGMK
ncbi:hypothetical protein OOT00_03605 [Desulfobotulus sp. H1]|uniref:FeoB-associated Cys-rich membrane protein n=1 Tax=Desulfobotulus pelophilus TaxID=2823377 RepID=A0ABT3N6H9_9BACT|nr:hypothetical protein [Desulfobotulus pelophilus]MCW7753069.1 hypothetical protein [Desulfobotulus pelophilus]